MKRLSISVASNIGCVRRQNEDMILVGSHLLRDDKYTTEVNLGDVDRYLVAVADGMGGHNRGDVASSDVLHSLRFYYYDMPAGLGAGDFNEMMVDWLEYINGFIASKGRADEQFKGMGTTLVGLAFYAGHFYSLNCGDSRLYRFRDGKLVQLTNDHSLDNMLGMEKRSSVITNCIGGGCGSSYMDIVQITDEVMPDDVYMLCSDGLTDMLSDATLAMLLADSPGAEDIVNAAVAAGGLDNVSVCIVKVKENLEIK